MKAIKNKLPFLTAKVYLKDRFDISITDDEFIEKAYPIWRNIGNRSGGTFSVIRTIPELMTVDLPADCESIKSVTTYDSVFNPNDYHIDSSGAYYNVSLSKEDQSQEYNDRMPESFVTGESVNYRNEGDYIYITSPGMVGRRIAIVYHSMDLDSDSLPLLNDKEVEAIALMMALRDAEKAMWQGQQGAVQKLNYIKPLAEQAVVVARTPEYINDDQIDEMLNVKYSSNRKTYGDRFRFR